MKKIIRGRLYDTDTAKLIGSWNNGFDFSNFHHCEEYLFLKRNGEYFLNGSGGAMSKYSESRGDYFCGGEDIIPMTEQEAKEWAEEHLKADVYLEFFNAEE